jgi:hypothetical protein
VDDGIPSSEPVEQDVIEGTEVVRIRRESVFRKIITGEIVEMQTVSAILLAELKVRI